MPRNPKLREANYTREKVLFTFEHMTAWRNSGAKGEHIIYVNRSIRKTKQKTPVNTLLLLILYSLRIRSLATSILSFYFFSFSNRDCFRIFGADALFCKR